MASRNDRDDSRRGRDDEDTPRRGRDEEPRRGGRDRDEPRSSRGRDEEDTRRSGRDRDEEAPRGGRDRGRDEEEPRRGGRGYDFEYKPRSVEQTRERANKGANDYDKILKANIKMWKPNDGDNRIRILPPTWEGADHFGYDIYVHYGVGPDHQSYLCLEKGLGKPDPIHEEREKARQELTDSKEDQQYLKDLDAKRRVLLYLIDRDDEKEGPQAWAAPWTFDRDLVKICEDKDTGEVINIDDPEDGYDVTFEKKGKGARTEYLGVSIARRPSPLGAKKWMKFAVDNPLPDQLEYFDYDHIAKAFGAQGDHRERARSRDDDRDDDRSSRSSRGGRDDPPARGGRDRIAEDDRPDRGRDAGSGGTRGRRPEPEVSWETVHAMTMRELENLVEQERLDIEPNDAKDDEDLADWICDEMKLKKKEDEPRRGGRDRDDGADAKMTEMRKRREG